MKLTVPEAARLLHVPEREVYAWIRDRGLPYVRVQERVFIHRAHLYEWARDRDLPLDPTVFGESEGAELAEALHAGGLHWLAAPVDEAGAAHAMMEALPLVGIGTEAACAVLLARKDLGFVVERDGIAIPRLHEPILACPRTALHLFAFAATWRLGAAGVSRVFVVVGPTVAAHQRLVAELGAALHRPAFRLEVAAPESVAALAAAAQ